MGDLNTISKIFVIHLDSCVGRKVHLENEFKRMNISNYEIFNAIRWDSDEVKEKFNSGFVKKPPCFRCNKNECNHKNNVLQEKQIGNWCSFINIMKKIVDEKVPDLIMICEDDIKFVDNYHVIMNKLLDKETFIKYTIDINKPLLIRLGNSFGSKINLNEKNLKLVKDIIMANPCFMINLEFARSFLDNLNCIETTSDIFIHNDLINKDKSIQHFTLIPQIAHDLSYGPIKLFKSTIRV